MPASPPPDEPSVDDAPTPPAPPPAALAPDAPAPSDPDEAPVSAFDRVQTRVQSRIGTRRPTSFTDAAGARGAFWRLVSILVALGAVVAVVVWWIGRDAAGDADLLVRYADVAADYQPALLTVNAGQAEQYVEETSGWVIGVPELPALQLVGVGFADLSPEASVPAFRYDGIAGESAIVFAYDYVFLDSIRGRFSLPEAVYAGLAEEEPVDTRRLDGSFFVTWRRRAVIFTAVTDDEGVFERIGVGVLASE